MKALDCSIRIGWKEHRRPLLEKTPRSFFEIKRILLSNVFFYCFRFEGCCWQSLSNGASSSSMRMTMTTDLQPRSDSGVINSSPVVTMTPIVRLLAGCQHSIRIPGMHGDCRGKSKEIFDYYLLPCSENVLRVVVLILTPTSKTNTNIQIRWK